MYFAVSIIGYIVAFPLELLVIAALTRGAYRKFPAVFAYAIANFFSTVIELPLRVDYYLTKNPAVSHRFVFWYWLDEFVLQALVFVVVMSLIWQATGEARSRRPLRTALTVGSLLVAGISFVVHFDPHVAPGLWMTPWARDLNFASAILDMVLWALLIAKRQKDSRVLMLSGGLGIMFTGEAIGESLRNMSRSVVLAGGVLMVLTNLVFLYIWWQTLRAARSAASVPLTRTAP
jgi:hypothetical protein